MLDLTGEIALDPKSYRKYRYFQIAAYAIAVFLAFYLGYLIAFPAHNFVFYPENLHSDKNTVTDPRNSQEAGGKQALIFDAVSPGNYSRIQIDLALNKKINSGENIGVETRKSFQAFLYPEGDPVGFRDGTLIRDENIYFIISQGKERKFDSNAILSSLGYNKESFVEVGDDDLKYNEKGDDISNSFSYPDGSLFKINNNYYILENQKLQEFVSPSAYLTQYDENQAIEKNEDFLKNYPLEGDKLGFADGTLVSYGISVFIVSSGKILPVDNATDFLYKGYQWSDLVPATADELSLYEKDKLFNITSPHPNGTVMKTADSGRWYLIKNGQKHLLPSRIIANTWSKKDPVLVSEKSLVPLTDCHLQKGILSSTNYSCVMPIESLDNLLGQDYEFKLAFGSSVKINTTNVSFQKTANISNLKLAVLNLISKIRGNYVPQAPTPIQ